nr:putative ribonuclease H-like domain-containing protein [Tanacetum cinerariifolium]
MFEAITIKTTLHKKLSINQEYSDCESWPPSSLYNRFQPSGGYHVVPPLTTGTFMPPKRDLVFHTTPIVVETDHSAFTVQLSPTKPAQDFFVQSFEQVKPPRHSVQSIETSILVATPKPSSLKSNSSGKRRNRKACFLCKSVDHLIKDCDYHAKKMAQPTPRNYAYRGNHKQYASLTHLNPLKHMVPDAVLTQSKPISITIVRPVSAVVPKIMMTRPRLAYPIVTKSKSPIRRNITRSQSPKTSDSPPRVTAVQALVVSDAQGNMSYLSNFEELPGRYVTFGGNPKGGKISGKEKTKTCVAYKKGKQHRASCKTKPVSSVNQPLFRLHMDLFGPTFVKSLNKKSYCLVVTDDYSRFTWVFFLATKDETSPILKTFITGLKNQLSLKDPIEAARIMLADSLLPIPFWAKAVNTTCYVQNKVLVTKPHKNTPYELLHGRTPSIGFIRPFGYPVTILNTLDSLGKVKGKVDEKFHVGYSVNSKAFRVFNSRTRIIQETLHVNFLENKPNIVGSGPTWLFDIDSLQRTMNYQPVTAGNQTNPSAGFQDKFDVEKAGEEINQQYVLFPVWSFGSTNPQNYDEDTTFDGKEHDFDARKPNSEVILSPSSSAHLRKQDDKTKKEAKGKIPTVRQNTSNRTNPFSTVGPSNTIARSTNGKYSFIDASQLSDDTDMPELEDITYSDDENDVGTEADFNNLETSITAPRAWYETLANYLLENGFQSEKIDQTLFIKKQKGDILLIQIYVDDIIFSATNKDLCKSFENLMKDKFQMSSMGELTFFLGLQVKQKKDRIFISQDKYVAKILRKFRLTKGKSASTPIDIEKPLLKDPDGEDVDVHTYRSMIGSLRYLTSSRLDIMFACKKQTVVATSSTEVEYVAAASCCAHVLWI